MRFRAQIQGATTDFETQKEHDQQLDRVLANLCIPGATWKLSTGQQRVPIQLRRQELNPIDRGWHELSIHSLIPSSNRSEIPVIRAILIHCIMKGEDVRAEDIIAYKIVRMAQGIKEKGKLGFPSTIYKLCKEAGVPLREFRRTKKIQLEEWNRQGYLDNSNTSSKTMRMRINQCLNLKKKRKKNKDMNMTTTTNQNLTTSQSMSTIKTSKNNHKCSNLHSIMSQPIQASMRRTCIV
ncbi:hypothetical protein PIB30_064509 [Stylosanthes scabra]|uniref:Putative plant transposon protein domain-containing protein n=1 Tax=Stylosanthes scabra TaxID=79078 RepID=A0ABU6YMI1_9FABA|nr:hypothetical protein [Stylosanthes scabra]